MMRSTLQAATDHGVAVCFAPGTNQEAVAEHAFALFLSLIRNVPRQDAAIRRGEWPRKVVGFARTTTLGIVGLGRIGKAMATRANAFGFEVLATEIAPDLGFCEANRVALVPFEELLKRSDVVTLHVPKTPLTKNLIRRETLELMKPTAFVINTSRGGVVHEGDLYEALKAKRIAGAGLDVFEKEPPGSNPLFALDNVILTAHTAGCGPEVARGHGPRPGPGDRQTAGRRVARGVGGESVGQGEVLRPISREVFGNCACSTT